MMTDLRKRMAELATAEEACLNPTLREQKAEAMKRFDREHPGQRNEINKKSMQKHPETYKRWKSTRIYTNKAPSRVLKSLAAPYKREKVEVCELCGGKPKQINWHHWVWTNPSVGLYICFACDRFAETVDGNDLQLGEKYFNLKCKLDDMYSNGERVELAKKYNIRSYLKTTVGGIHKRYNAWGKRSRSADGLCELCGVKECHKYHHWDDDILGKGLWACQNCDGFAERVDAHGQSFIEKYLTLKAQDEARVCTLMEIQNNN